MTAKTSISPSAQATTAGPEASVPPSDSGSVQAEATCAECQRARSSSTQNRSRRPGPQVLAARPLGARCVVFDSLMASDDTRSPPGTSGARGWSSAGERTTDGPLGRPVRDPLVLERGIERACRRGKQAAQAMGAATEAAAPGRNPGIRGPAAAREAQELGLLEEVLLVQRCDVGCECVHGWNGS